MTTERKPNRVARLGVHPLELRLYIVALLGAVFAISWRAIGGEIAATEPQSTTPPREPQRVVWVDDLPPDMRPTIALPPGWERATESVAVLPPRVVRVPGRRAPRVRTRSS